MTTPFVDVPDVLNLRLVDARRVLVIGNAISNRSVDEVLKLCDEALFALSRVDARRWTGRFSSADWTRSARFSLEATQRNLASSKKTSEWDQADVWGTDLLRAIAMPWFQADYLLEFHASNEAWNCASAKGRDYPVQIRSSTAEFDTEQESVDFFRTLCRPHGKHRLDVRIKEVEPCSFIAVGFLDGGAYRRILEKESDAVAHLLSSLQRSSLRVEDIMWIAPPEWLAGMSELLAKHSPAADLIPRFAALRACALDNGLQIAVSGTYGAEC